MARIAILGWGSLIWDPGELAIASRWHVDGPCLPIEFARKSSRDRVTLVVVPDDSHCSHYSRTYWALSSFDGWSDTAENLRVREGRTRREWIRIADAGHSWSLADPGKLEDLPGRIVCAWLNEPGRPEYAVWTGIPADGFAIGGSLAQQVVQHLKGLGGGHDAEAHRYIELAPASVDTPVRTAIEEELGWERRPLPKSLFEDPGGSGARGC